MNAEDVMKYGHRTLMGAIKRVPETELETGGVTGVWSTKDIFAHLTSYEHVLAEVLNAFVEDGGPTAYIDMMRDPNIDFNNTQVDMRKDKDFAEIMAEYEEVRARAMSLLTRSPVEKRRQPGTIPWYGEEYDLEDLIVYTNYAHKREHSAEIGVFADRLGH